MVHISSSVTNSEIIVFLEKIAQLLELAGENPFKARAYTRAAKTIELLTESVSLLVQEKRLSHIDGIGVALEAKISEFVMTGRSSYCEELMSHFPPTLFELFELQGLGAKKIHQLYKELHVSSIDDLEKICKSGKVATLPGFGEKSTANIEKAIAFYREQSGLFRIDEVTELATILLEDLRAHPDVGQCQHAGSFRRHKEAIGDLDLLVSSTKPASVSDFFIHHPLVEKIMMQGPTKSSVRLKATSGGHAGLQCDLRVVKPGEFPFALLYFTGSKEHNIRLRSRALERGWSLNEYRFTIQEEKKKETFPIGSPPEIHHEEELYEALGLQFIPPELREDRGEIAAAQERRLPELLEWHHLKGTFHCHTTASDGENSLLEMAIAAEELGLEYLGIADHSKSSYQAHGLDEMRLAVQIEEIRKLNQTLKGIHLFAGSECDILKDGSLDFSDDVLASLDYVVASVHSSFTQGEAEMTKRIIRAIENPYVTMIGHLTGRILFSRASYALDIPAILEAAASTGTWIELNANPKRLDMDWRWWSLAKEKGVHCVINPDAHHILGIQNLIYGVGIARKGCLTKKDVVNCLSLEKIKAALGARKEKPKPVVYKPKNENGL